MGLLNVVAGALMGGAAGGGNPLLGIVMKMMSNQGGSGGGLAGLVQSFQSNGLGEQVASWISTGANLPVSGDQIKKAFSGGQLGQIAGQAGVSENEAASGLADMLPNVIDKLTPDGKLPEGDLLAKGLSLLQGKLFG